MANSFERAQQSLARAAKSGTEPPSGQSGAGTVDSPYDGGNAPENPTADSRPKTPSEQPTNNGVQSPSTAHQGSGLPEKRPSPAQAEKILDSKQKAEATQQNKTSTKPVAKSTGLAADGGNFDAARRDAGKEAERLLSLDRDVSPGTRDDGSHATTSGDRGESYEPGGKLDKLKSKFHFGKS